MNTTIKAEAGEYWCPDCGEKRASDYQEVAEKCGQRGRGIWLCPECAADLIEVEHPVEVCPLCGDMLTGSVPTSDQGAAVECPEHGDMTIQVFRSRTQP